VRRKSRCRIRDLLADGRCSQAILDRVDFPSTTDVGRRPRLMKTRGAGCHNGSSGSAGGGKRRGEWRRRSWVLERRNRFFSRRLLHGVCGRGAGDGSRFLLFFPSFLLCHSLCNFFSLVRILFSWDRLGWKAKGELATCRLTWTADGLKKSAPP